MSRNVCEGCSQSMVEHLANQSPHAHLAHQIEACLHATTVKIAYEQYRLALRRDSVVRQVGGCADAKAGNLEDDCCMHARGLVHAYSAASERKVESALHNQSSCSLTAAIVW